MIEDLIKYTIKNMMHRFTRSSLTILSILIGIMAIFTLVSFGQGLSRYVDQISQETGADKLVAQPKGFGPPGSTNTFLTKEDLDFIKKINGVSEATALIAQQAEVKKDVDKKGKFVFALGMTTDSSEQRVIDEVFGGIGIDKGRAITKFPAIKLFNTKYAKNIEEGIKQAGYEMQGTFTKLPEINIDEIDEFNFSPILKQKIKIKLKQYIDQMNNRVLLVP